MYVSINCNQASKLYYDLPLGQPGLRLFGSLDCNLIVSYFLFHSLGSSRFCGFSQKVVAVVWQGKRLVPASFTSRLYRPGLCAVCCLRQVQVTSLTFSWLWESLAGWLPDWQLGLAAFPLHLPFGCKTVEIKCLKSLLNPPASRQPACLRFLLWLQSAVDVASMPPQLLRAAFASAGHRHAAGLCLLICILKLHYKLRAVGQSLFELFYLVWPSSQFFSSLFSLCHSEVYLMLFVACQESLLDPTEHSTRHILNNISWALCVHQLSPVNQDPDLAICS